MQTSIKCFIRGKITPKQTYSMKQHGTGERVTSGTSEGEKDLGVLMDSELKFSKRVEEQVNKANKIHGLIRRSYQYLDRESMKMLFTALVRPHLDGLKMLFGRHSSKKTDC